MDVASADQITTWNHLSDAGTAYHPQTVNDMAMLKHLATTSTSIGLNFRAAAFSCVATLKGFNIRTP